jgi:predicted peptidase
MRLSIREKRSTILLLGLLLSTVFIACVPGWAKPVIRTYIPSQSSVSTLISPRLATTTRTVTPTHTLTPAVLHCQPVPGKIQQACNSQTTGLQYWLYLPPEGKVPRGQKLPLLIFLHGFNHSGSDLSRVLENGPPMEVENGRMLPMVVISPQCPEGDNWQFTDMLERLGRFVDEVTFQFGVDPKRVYLTGFSMGGDGVWALGLAYPEKFAALAPVGSWYADLSNICALSGVPVWDFNGKEDTLVPPSYAEKITEALKNCGGNVQLTLFPAEGHTESALRAYSQEELYQWLLQKTR